MTFHILVHVKAFIGKVKPNLDFFIVPNYVVLA